MTDAELRAAALVTVARTGFTLDDIVSVIEHSHRLSAGARAGDDVPT
jgi:hypothetical protein